MKQLVMLNLENVTPEEEKTYRIRNAARAVIFDFENKIALMKDGKHLFYKLPGGGVEEGEDIIEALRRECLEEAGVEIDVPQELGSVKEIKKVHSMVQNSYCYITIMTGKKNEPQFTESEKANDFELMWVTLEEAIKLVGQVKPLNIFGQYVTARESAILKAAMDFKNK
jgi:8-oxo-dGTP pyrophosphatase MutT (NUDIX family)